MRKILPLILLAILFSSCATQQNVIYLQDNILNTLTETAEGGEIRFQPNDVISIYVSSRNPELASVFNGGVNLTSSSTSKVRGLGFMIDLEGNIDFPILGQIKVAGFTKIELERYLKSKIIESKMIDDPTLTVEYQNLTFSTIGEVANPGIYSISKEKTTIFEALSQSGDLTINGLRDRVYLTRREDNALITYQVDLRSREIYQSPAFYIQQNDMIYVEPNNIRANQSTTNGNTVRTTSFWMSLASFLTSMTLIFL